MGLDFIGSGISTMISEARLDGDYTRFALLAASPFLICVSLVICFFKTSIQYLIYIFPVLRPSNHHEYQFRVSIPVLLLITLK